MTRDDRNTTVRLPTIVPPEDDRRPHRRRLRSVAVLPTLMTIGHLMCGFAAIHFGLRAMFAIGAGGEPPATPPHNILLMERILPTLLSIGGMFVVLGMIIDSLDGFVARVTRRTTAFGGQMDSLADMVCCGVAPAVLMIVLLARELGPDYVVGPLSDHALGRAVWAAAAVYITCAALRLARFNVEHAESHAPMRTFKGLPSPAAACVLATLIVLHEHLGPGPTVVIVYALPPVAVVLGVLMVSRITYVRIGPAYLRRRRPFEHLMIFVAVLAVFMAYKVQTLTALTCWYALSGPAEWLYRRVGGKPAGEAPADGGTDAARDNRAAERDNSEHRAQAR